MTRTIVAFTFQDEWCVSIKSLDDLDDNHLTISHRFRSIPILRTTPSDTARNGPYVPSKETHQHTTGNFVTETFVKKRSDDRRY